MVYNFMSYLKPMCVGGGGDMYAHVWRGGSVTLLHTHKIHTVADPGGGGGRGAPPSKKVIKNEDLFFYNFVVKNVFYQYL